MTVRLFSSLLLVAAPAFLEIPVAACCSRRSNSKQQYFQSELATKQIQYIYIYIYIYPEYLSLFSQKCRWSMLLCVFCCQLRSAMQSTSWSVVRTRCSKQGWRLVRCGRCTRTLMCSLLVSPREAAQQGELSDWVHIILQFAVPGVPYSHIVSEEPWHVSSNWHRSSLSHTSVRLWISNIFASATSAGPTQKQWSSIHEFVSMYAVRELSPKTNQWGNSMPFFNIISLHIAMISCTLGQLSLAFHQGLLPYRFYYKTWDIIDK